MVIWAGPSAPSCVPSRPSSTSLPWLAVVGRHLVALQVDGAVVAVAGIRVRAVPDIGDRDLVVDRAVLGLDRLRIEGNLGDRAWPRRNRPPYPCRSDPQPVVSLDGKPAVARAHVGHDGTRAQAGDRRRDAGCRAIGYANDSASVSENPRGPVRVVDRQA